MISEHENNTTQETDTQVNSINQVVSEEQKTENLLANVFYHLTSAIDTLDKVPSTKNIAGYKECDDIEGLITQFIVAFEIRKAATQEYVVKPTTVLLLKSNKEVNTTIYKITTDEHGVQHALMKSGRGVKEVFYSNLMNKWCTVD